MSNVFTASENSLQVLATKIKGRAVQRAGILAKEIEAAKGARNDLGPKAGNHLKLGRYETMREAGFSERQTKQAIRVANIPNDEFEQHIYGVGKLSRST